MFRIEAEPKFWATVAVALPGEPPATFRARFRVAAVSETAAADLDEPASAAKFLSSLIVDLDEIEDERGTKAAFGEALVAALLDRPHVRAALMRAYAQGVAAAARGN
jgi:hypothetical protein